MKRKKFQSFAVIGIILVIMVLLLIPHHLTNIKIDDIGTIQIDFNKKGKTERIISLNPETADFSNIEHLLNNWNSISIKAKGISSPPSKDWYRVTITKKNGEEYKNFVLYNEKYIFVSNIQYKLADGTIDLDFISNLFLHD
jgi:hypothetical protein